MALGKFKNLFSSETDEEISTVNPGKAEQKVILEIPRNKVERFEKDWIIRRKK